jgi:hypothetical protein
VPCVLPGGMASRDCRTGRERSGGTPRLVRQWDEQAAVAAGPDRVRALVRSGRIRRRLAWGSHQAVKKRRTFMIEPDILDKLRAIKDRTGLSESEQVRQGIRWWLESREWPPRKAEPRHASEEVEKTKTAAPPARRRARKV